jgi:RimJ/RimL family protein N-acetyltransferase
MGDHMPDTANTTSSVTFRPVEADDDEFLLKVYTSSREYEMSLIPLSDEQKQAFLKMQITAQQNHYRAYYPDAQHLIILLGGEPVGRIYVNRGDREIRILDVTLLIERRNAGIGTPIIKSLMEEASQAGKSVSIYVENYNRSARLFERLGFTVAERDDFNTLFAWRPGA